MLKHKLRHAVPCCAVLRCTVLCCAVLCSALLCSDAFNVNRVTIKIHTSGMLPAFLQECGPDLPFPGLVAIWSHYNKLGRCLEHFCKVESVCQRV